MTGPISSSTTWPAARRTGIGPIQHPAWEEARNAILDLVAEGPVTVLLVGEAGTGKSWLLRELTTSLGEHGFPTMMLMQGDLPMALSQGGALLVDEAARMPEATRATLLAQRHGVAILADLEHFADAIDAGVPGPVVIRLRAMDTGEIASFVSEWLEIRGLSTSAIDAAALTGLIRHSGGRVRSIVQLLGAATTMGKMSGRSQVTKADIDEVAELRLGGLTPSASLPAPLPPAANDVVAVPPAATMIMSAPPRRRPGYRAALAGSAIAASIALGWALIPTRPPAAPDQRAGVTKSLPPLQLAETRDPAPAVAPVQTATPALPAPSSELPALQTATISAPALAAAPSLARPSIAVPPMVEAHRPDTVIAGASPSPAPATADIVHAQSVATPNVVAAPAPPPVLHTPTPATPEPTVVATIDAQVPYPPIAQSARAQPDRRGGPGLVLVAQHGDTLESLYGSIYRDRQAPPYAAVVAANPAGFRPGGIVIFPAPPGGWQRAQR